MTATRYADYPDHPLHDVPQEILDVAHKELALCNEVHESVIEPVADAIVMALHESGYINIPKPRIRATHPYAFRSGQWAILLGQGQQWVPRIGGGEQVLRDVYIVQFPDGVIDTWPVLDRDAMYVFEGDE